MKSILEALYGGWLLPVEMNTPKDPEYRQINQKIDELKEGWQKKLGEEDGKLLDTILDLCHVADSMEVRSSFEYSFRLGAALMVEVLAGREELVRPKDYLK
jgi:hypothetical protein